jgi:aspartate ammonia-lyase
MIETRLEEDFLGQLAIPADALYGIQSVRASQNFPDSSRFNLEWYKAMGAVKLACYQTCHKYYEALKSSLSSSEIPFRIIEEEKLKAMEQAAIEIMDGKWFDQFIVPATQGGAGTSINMNINEIIANRALLISGEVLGNYSIFDPIEHSNIYQSTNDVVPTALRIAIMRMLQKLEFSIDHLRKKTEETEKIYRDTPRLAYTQMQAAVPSTYGQLFSSYNDALARDWWRVSKAMERIKVVNLGGSAIGTAIGVPQFFVMEATPMLRLITHLPVTRGENLSDITQNQDSVVEVHAILKALAVNLEKISSDLRLLASNLIGSAEVKIPARQVGSSIMPAKVNPVIVEYVICETHKVYANDQLITSLAASGCLDLNAYIPTIGDALLSSIQSLTNACLSLADNLIADLMVDKAKAESKLFESPAVATAIAVFTGYHKASILSKYMTENNCSVFDANLALNIIPHDQLEKILDPARLTKLGFNISDFNNL